MDLLTGVLVDPDLLVDDLFATGSDRLVRDPGDEAEVGIEIAEESPGERGLAQRIHEANGLAQAVYREALG